MAWKARCVMDERFKFVSDCLKKEWSMAELCRNDDKAPPSEK